MVPSRESVREAYARIAPHVRKTPLSVARVQAPDGFIEVQFKHEYLQYTGSFKARGALNSVLGHEGVERICAASGGNHGIAAAWAAERAGAQAIVFVPETTPSAKKARILSFGAELREVGSEYAHARAACAEFAAKEDALQLHAFGNADTINGQGSVGLEWEQAWEAPLDTLLVATGGGGLVCGIGAHFAGSNTRVLAVEPMTSCALYSALEANAPVDVSVSGLAIDSLGARNVGSLVLASAKRAGIESLRVEDEAIRQAMALLWHEHRIALEPGGAAALAALTSGAYVPAAGERVGVLLCGANVDLERFQTLVA